MRHYFPEKEYNKVEQTLLQLKTTNSTRTSRDRPLTWRHGNENWRNFRWNWKLVSSKKGNAKIIALILHFWSELLFSTYIFLNSRSVEKNVRPVKV